MATLEEAALAAHLRRRRLVREEVGAWFESMMRYYEGNWWCGEDEGRSKGSIRGLELVIDGGKKGRRDAAATCARAWSGRGAKASLETFNWAFSFPPCAAEPWLVSASPLPRLCLAFAATISAPLDDLTHPIHARCALALFTLLLHFV